MVIALVRIHVLGRGSRKRWWIGDREEVYCMFEGKAGLEGMTDDDATGVKALVVVCVKRRERLERC